MAPSCMGSSFAGGRAAVHAWRTACTTDSHSTGTSARNSVARLSWSPVGSPVTKMSWMRGVYNHELVGGKAEALRSRAAGTRRTGGTAEEALRRRARVMRRTYWKVVTISSPSRSRR